MRDRNEDFFELFPDKVDGAPVLAPPLTHLIDLEVYEKSREVFVSGEIDEDFGNWITMVFRRLESQSQEPITVWINTPGGDVTSMFVFHDIVRSIKSEVLTIGTGQVCSAGVLMLACGNRRLVTESCILMSHRGEEGMVGKLEELKAQLEVAEWAERHWATLMARYTSKDEKHWFQLGKKSAQWWVLGGQNIIIEGLADGLYNPDDA